jgi:hypothetical protein
LWIGCNPIDFNEKINFCILVVSLAFPLSLSLDLGVSWFGFSLAAGYLLLFLQLGGRRQLASLVHSFPALVSAGRVQVLRSLSEPISRAAVFLYRPPLRFSSMNFASFSSISASPGLRLGSRWIRPVPAPQIHRHFVFWLEVSSNQKFGSFHGFQLPCQKFLVHEPSFCVTGSACDSPPPYSICFFSPAVRRSAPVSWSWSCATDSCPSASWSDFTARSRSMCQGLWFPIPVHR